MPLATGCTLWFALDDPFDGLGEGAGGADATGGGEGGSLSDGSIPDEPPDCGPLDAATNCGACGVSCGSSACLPSKVDVNDGPYHCGAAEVSTATAGVPQAITVWNDRLYLLDTSGNVWVCDGACDTDSFTRVAMGSGTGCTIAASSKGIFWSTLGPDVINHVDFDGGLHPTVAAIRPQFVAASGNRVAWTSGTGETCDAFNKPPVSGTLFFVASPALGGLDGGASFTETADLRNVAFIEDGGTLVWTSGEDALRSTALHDDGGYDPIKDFGDAGVGNLVIGSNGQDLAVTIDSKNVSGSVYDLSDASANLLVQSTTQAGVYAAAVFFGKDTIYWSDSETSISYCAPNPPGRCGPKTTIELGFSTPIPIAEIAATSKHIFFTVSGTGAATLYRIDALP